MDFFLFHPLRALFEDYLVAVPFTPGIRVNKGTLIAEPLHIQIAFVEIDPVGRTCGQREGDDRRVAFGRMVRILRPLDVGLLPGRIVRRIASLLPGIAAAARVDGSLGNYAEPLPVAEIEE